MTSCLIHYCWQPSIYSPQICNLYMYKANLLEFMLHWWYIMSLHVQHFTKVFISGPTTLTSRVVDCCIATRKQTFYSIWTDYSSRAIWECTAAKIWTFWKVQWKHSYLTIWFAGIGLAPTTHRYCGFNATLACSVMDERCNTHTCIYIDIYVYMHTHLINIIQYDSYLTIFCTITCRYDFNRRFQGPGRVTIQGHPCWRIKDTRCLKSSVSTFDIEVYFCICN